MKTKIISLLLTLVLVSCDPKDLQRVLDTVGGSPLTELDISNGLKEALQFGVDNSVNFLSAKDGYYKSIYKIVLPEEAYVVIDKLKFIPGFSNLEEELIKKINYAAEDAAKKAGPIFLDAVRGITFDDAMNILMGEKNAATTYLHDRTYNSLYNEFKPVLVSSLNQFGALDYWADAVNTYNKIPLLNDVNPDLADHINSKALYGLFDLIEEKELGIRSDLSQRTTSLLQKVFAKQD
ncbi:MAG: DUF4197 domain-containing protein [Bacteroidia bacterium]|nr:DUF4197 domain-containing protein [Bacteroidia bacterium]